MNPFTMPLVSDREMLKFTFSRKVNERKHKLYSPSLFVKHEIP